MYRKSHLPLAVSAALGLSTVTAMPAIAQNDPSDAQALEEVIVTAQRRETDVGVIRTEVLNFDTVSQTGCWTTACSTRLT